ncbi:hypothetical protein [Paraburkholderia hayleyella]|uniref:hypothetical protein n=1 Tax=Paraburkholderia hayleyella TaxID=2152889 RepID=UPI001290AAE8|nr:hypothetical protein [Paraburkholderia hayleyella]
MADCLRHPLESGYEIFPANAETLRLPTAAIALYLNRAHQLAAGARVVCCFLRNNGAAESDESGLPLSPVTTEGLLQLTELAARQFIDSLEEAAVREVTTCADAHSVMERPE